ncbi:MAG: TiaS agmantine-binding domain-containing protein [Thermoproteota archaeon]
MADSVQLHIGIDDTDSLAGGCTTYLASLMVEVLLRDFSAKFTDYPLLIRLNPNIPWKTRGNGAVCIRVKIPRNSVFELKQRLIEMVLKYSDMQDSDTDPAIVFFEEKKVGDDFRAFYDEALRKVIPLERALRFAEQAGCEVHAYKTEKGVVGCLAAIGAKLDGDFTFELISYRRREYWGKERLFDKASVLSMDAKMRRTFNNIDPETGRVLITPHGKDPVLLGIRGEDPFTVLEAFRILRILEPVERWTIFRSNQGTDAHLPSIPVAIASIEPFESVCIEGTVIELPRRIQGGHVIFLVRDGTGELECAAYEPTGSFRNLVSKLGPGDHVKVYGGIRLLEDGRITLNTEKIEIMELKKVLLSAPPICPRCKNKCKSSGLRQGYRCRKCGIWVQGPKICETQREIEVGTFLPPPRAHRHLTKPLCRYGIEKKGIFPTEPIEPWHMP